MKTNKLFFAYIVDKNQKMGKDLESLKNCNYMTKYDSCLKLFQEKKNMERKLFPAL